MKGGKRIVYLRRTMNNPSCALNEYIGRGRGSNLIYGQCNEVNICNRHYQTGVKAGACKSEYGDIGQSICRN